MDALLEKSENLLNRTTLQFVRRYLRNVNWKNRLIGFKGNRGTDNNFAFAKNQVVGITHARSRLPHFR